MCHKQNNTFLSVCACSAAVYVCGIYSITLYCCSLRGMEETYPSFIRQQSHGNKAHFKVCEQAPCDLKQVIGTLLTEGHYILLHCTVCLICQQK